MSGAVRSLWAEPRAAAPPAYGWRDGVVVAVLVASAVLEVIVRREPGWHPVALVLAVAPVCTLWWRRSNPLLVVAVAFGAQAAADVATVLGAGAAPVLYTGAYVVLLPYALLRWGAGREAAIGLAIILVAHALRESVLPTGVVDALIGSAFLLFPAALGAAVRSRTNLRLREIEQVKLRERAQLARELHDTVAHHISAVAIQAQAGRTVAEADPDRALHALEAIEAAASRTLAEMRIMVGVLRRDREDDLAPQRGVGDIARLARSAGDRPHVAVELSGDLDDLRPSVGAALYRLAQESVTNSVRHARHATRITVAVAGDDERVHLTVRDDGDATGWSASPGYGLVGMTERATLLGGTLEAGPSPRGGWTVDALLPKRAPVR